ncbi:MAG: hypothetical protein ACFFDN_12645 [Candidatus Hodarchaeota archaeon]
MGKKAAGIIGGILVLLCASGFFALQWFVIMPANQNYASASSNMTLWMMDARLNVTHPDEPDTLIPWNTTLIESITLEDFILIDFTMKMAPVVDINFCGVISLPIMICVFILVGMSAIGGILAIAGAGED